METPSNINILADIITDGDKNDALRWIESSHPDTDYSIWRNEYEETIAQFAVLPQNDMPRVAIALIKRMNKKSLDNRDEDNNCLLTSSVYYADLMQALMSTDIDFSARNADGITVIALLAELGALAIMINIITKYKLTISDKKSDSALILSAVMNKNNVVRYLLKNNVDLEDHFIERWGKMYLKELKEYKRKDEYIEMFANHNLMELVPKTVHDIFMF